MSTATANEFKVTVLKMIVIELGVAIFNRTILGGYIVMKM